MFFPAAFYCQEMYGYLPSTGCPIYANVVGLDLQCSFEIHLMWSLKRREINVCGEAASRIRDLAILNIFSALYFISFQFKK